MIRDADVEDVGAIAAVEAACFGGAAWSLSQIRDHLAAAHRIALIDGDLKAYGTISMLGDVADLDRIAVLPAVQRQGRAVALLDALINRSHAQGAKRMMLEVAADNDPAIKLYEAFGFESISRRPHYYPGGIDALVMQRDLEEIR